MKKENYGWAICFACALLLFCTNGLATTGFSAYQPYLIHLGGLTNTQASAVIFFRNLFGLIAMCVTTPLIHKFEVRRIVTAGMVVCGISFVVYGYAAGFSGYCLAAALAGSAMGIGGMIPVSIVISRWFQKHRGLALGICMAATGVSALVAAPCITLMVREMSLRFSFLAEGIFAFAAAIAVHMVLRSRPDCLDTRPIGAGNSVLPEKVYASHRASRSAYGCMLLGLFLFGMSGNTLYAYISVLYQSAGFEEMQVSWLLSAFGVALAAGKCAYGQIADKIGVYRASWILYTLTIAGNALCCLAGIGGYGAAMAGVILMGGGLAVTTVSISMYASGVTTETDYSRTVTRFQMLSTLGALLFGTVPGMIADRTGSYIPAFAIMLAIAAVSACLLQFTYHRIRRADAAYSYDKGEKR